jgi:hypothetical protein
MEFWLLVMVLLIFTLIKLSSKEDKKDFNISYKKNVLETEISKKLSVLANQLGGIQFHDIMLEYNGVTCQIDNILLTNKALYVIEAKDFSGWIFGSEHQEYWRQTFAHYRSRDTGETVSRFSFFNPIKQNQEHIRILCGEFGYLDQIPIFNLVVFGMNAVLKGININRSGAKVVNMNRLSDTILRLDEKLTRESNLQDKEDFINQLHSKNITDKQKRLAHVQRIQEKYHVNKSKQSENQDNWRN